MEKEIEFKNSTEMNQFLRAVALQEDKDMQFMQVCTGAVVFYVMGFLIGSIALFGLWVVSLI